MSNLGKMSDIREVKTRDIARLGQILSPKLWTLKICVRLSSHLSLACQAFMAICPVPLNNSAVSPFLPTQTKKLGFTNSTLHDAPWFCDYFFVSASLLFNKV
jgi:hypothetical protein